MFLRRLSLSLYLGYLSTDLFSRVCVSVDLPTCFFLSPSSSSVLQNSSLGESPPEETRKREKKTGRRRPSPGSTSFRVQPDPLASRLGLSPVASLLHKIADLPVICATVNKLWATEDLAVITSFVVSVSMGLVRKEEANCMFTEREINRTKRKCIIADNCTFQVEKVSVSVPEWMLGIFAALEKD